jgi:hypothetical protein
MIVVRGVEVGTQRDTEVSARALVDGMKKARLGGFLPPVPAQRECAAVFQSKTGDIDGVGVGVLAAHTPEQSAAGNVAA